MLFGGLQEGYAVGVGVAGFESDKAGPVFSFERDHLQSGAFVGVSVFKVRAHTVVLMQKVVDFTLEGDRLVVHDYV